MQNCSYLPVVIELPAVYKTTTWDGLTWKITQSTSSEYDVVLSSARFQLQDANGSAVLTLTSADASEITLNITTANLSSITIEKRLLSLDVGIYSWALETTDADGTIKMQIIGTLNIKPDLIL